MASLLQGYLGVLGDSKIIRLRQAVFTSRLALEKRGRSILMEERPSG